METIIGLLLFCTTSIICAGDENGSCVQVYVDQTSDANVIIGGLFNIHEPASYGEGCDPMINIDAVQRLQAFLFAVDYINNKPLIPAIKFGALAYDTCGQSDEAVRKALQFAIQQSDKNGYCSKGPLFLGVVGPFYRRETEDVASLLTLSKLNQISYSTRALSLSDKQRYPYLSRVVANSKYVAQVILDVMVEIGWTITSIVLADIEDAEEIADQILRQSATKAICINSILPIHYKQREFPDIIPGVQEALKNGVRGFILLTSTAELTTQLLRYIDFQSQAHPILNNITFVHGLSYVYNGEHLKYPKLLSGSLSIEEYNNDISEFRKFLNRKLEQHPVDPWMSQYWEQIANINAVNETTGGTLTTSTQAPYVSQTISAVLTFAEALKNSMKATCPNTNGICPALLNLDARQFNSFIQNVSFTSMDMQNITFDENGDLANPAFIIKVVRVNEMHVSSHQLAKWTPSHGIQLLSNGEEYTLKSFPPSQYTENCVCLTKPPIEGFAKQAYHDVDILLVGIFDIHARGMDKNECDLNGVNEISIQALEAMQFAINEINSNSEILPNLRVGAFLLDSCRNPARVRRQIIELLKGNPVLITVVDGSSSEITKVIAELLKLYKIPVISSASTDPDLSDMSAYPYLMRTVPSDKWQAHAIIGVLKQLRWDYVTVFYSDSMASSFSEFLHLAKSEKICVASQLMLGDYFTDDVLAMEDLVNFYVSRSFPESHVIVLFTSDLHTRSLLSAYKSQQHKSGNMKRVIWIGTNTWGSRLDVVNGLETVADGAITVSLYAAHVPKFEEYFATRTPENNAQNPWFAEYWQQRFNCYIGSNYRNIYAAECTPAQNLANVTLHVADTVPYVIDSVYTMALALHKLITEQCSEFERVACINKFINSGVLLNTMRNVDFLSEITKLRVSYDMLGNGIPRYSLYNFRYFKGSNVYGYYSVGNWTNDKLEMESSNVTSYLTSLFGVNVTSTCESCRCSDGAVADLKYQMNSGGLTLTGYFPLHGSAQGEARCMTVPSTDGFLQYMAFRYAIDKVNEDLSLLGNVTLGYIAFDTCSDPDHASLAYSSWTYGLRLFTQKPQVPAITYTNAFIGGFNSDVTATLNKINSVGQSLVQISYEMGDLDSPDNYSHFLCTGTSHSEEFQAISDVLVTLQWTCLTAFYDNETEFYYHQMKNFLSSIGVCIRYEVNIDIWDSADDYSVSFNGIFQSKDDTIVISLVGGSEMEKLLRALNKYEWNFHLVWIGTNSAADQTWTRHTSLELIRGAMLIVRDVAWDPDFDAYMEKQSPATDTHNPWIEEFWEEYFQCNLRYRGRYQRICSGKETLVGRRFSHHPVLTQLINAVYSYATGITNLLNAKCGGVSLPPCQAFADSDAVYDYILRSKIRDAEGRMFSPYKENGAGAGLFKVINIQVKDYDNKTNFVQVGEWFNGTLSMNTREIRLYSSRGSLINLISSIRLETCHCSGSTAKESRDVLFSAHNMVWGLTIMVLTFVGIAFTLALLVLFVAKRHHQVVRISNLSISSLILFGIFLMFSLNFAFMASPSRVTCACRRVGLGMAYAVVFSSLMVKAIRINKVHNKASLSGQPSCVSGLSQATLALLCICVEVVLVAEWLVLRPPDVTSVLTSSSSTLGDKWRCANSDTSLVISLSLVYFLMIITLCLSIKSRQATEFYREARYIFIISTFSITIMICCAVILIESDEDIKPPATCICITLNAYLILLLMFLPKCIQFITFDRNRRNDEGSHLSNSTYVLQHRQTGKKKTLEKRMTYEHALAVVSGKYVTRDPS